MRFEDLLATIDTDEYVRIMRKEPSPVFTDGDTFKIIRRSDKVLYEGYVKQMGWREWNEGRA